MPSFTVPKEGPHPSPPSEEHSETRSPVAPPYSPITPVLSNTALTSMSASYPYAQIKATTEYPPPVPISESSDPDAIAVRACLSVLQIQRVRAIQDLQTLKRQKDAALADPEAYLHALEEGKVKTVQEQNLLWQASDSELPGDSYKDESDGEDGITASNTESGTTGQSEAHSWALPRAQNIVRCPPINWAKYHIVGEPLEKLHEDQKRQPMSGNSQWDESLKREHVFLAPYSPWKDKLPEGSTKTRTESRKGT